MRDILGWFGKWFLPYGIYAPLKENFYGKACRRDVADPRMARHKELKGIHHGKRCFILGCGPSISSQDLSPLEGEICISVSNFFVHPLFSKISPKYHCVTPLHPPFTDQDGIRWFREMERFMKQTTLFFSVTDEHLIGKNHLFSGLDVKYLHIEKDCPPTLEKVFDLSKKLPSCSPSLFLLS